MRRFAFEGIHVLDFTWYGVGPVTTKYLADNGADVIRIESAARLDGLRLAPPWKDGKPGIDNSQFFASYNTSKMGITLDMSKPKARESFPAAAAVGRRRERELHPQDLAQLGPRLRAFERDQTRPDHAFDLHAGSDRTASQLSRVRQPDGGAVGLLLHRRLLRDGAVPAVRRIYRFHRAAIFRLRADGRARLQAPHRQGPIHRYGAV